MESTFERLAAVDFVFTFGLVRPLLYYCIMWIEDSYMHNYYGVNDTIEIRVRVTFTHKRSEFHSFQKSAPCGDGFTPILE